MNDAPIRERLHAHLDRLGAPWADEVRVRSTRVDVVALVDGVLTGIEIKSAKDTLERLEAQYASYDRLFRQVLVVTEARHVAGVHELVGERCGIWVAEPASDDGDAVHLRTRSRALGTRRPRVRAKDHPARLVWFLRRGEILAALGLPEDAALSKAEAAQRLRETRSVDAVEAVVVEALRQRKLAAGKPQLASPRG